MSDSLKMSKREIRLLIPEPGSFAASHLQNEDGIYEVKAPLKRDTV